MIIMRILPDGSNTVTPSSMFQRLGCFIANNDYDKNGHYITHFWYNIKNERLI